MSIFSTVSMYLLNLVQSIYLQEIPLAIIKCSCGLHFSAITNYLDVPGGLNVSPNISCHFFHPKWLRRLSPFNRVVIPGSKKFIYLSSSKPTYYLVLSYSQFYYVIVSAFTPCSRGRSHADPWLLCGPSHFAGPWSLSGRPLVTSPVQSSSCLQFCSPSLVRDLGSSRSCHLSTPLPVRCGSWSLVALQRGNLKFLETHSNPIWK